MKYDFFQTYKTRQNKKAINSLFPFSPRSFHALYIIFSHSLSSSLFFRKWEPISYPWKIYCDFSSKFFNKWGRHDHLLPTRLNDGFNLSTSFSHPLLFLQLERRKKKRLGLRKLPPQLFFLYSRLPFCDRILISSMWLLPPFFFFIPGFSFSSFTRTSFRN